MKVLLEFLELSDMIMLEKATNLLEFNLSSIMNRAHNRMNPVKDFAMKPDENGTQTVPDDIVDKIDEAMKRLQAARTGLGLANKLKDPDQRNMHKSRIMKNLNLLRMIVLHIEQELGKGEPEPTNTPVQDREPVGNGPKPEPYMGGTTGMREEIDPKLVKAVDDFKHAKKELEKNPFGGKTKKAKKTKDAAGKVATS